ncbi:MAG TPA: bifunctional DNA-formamidopyrimidine glycosylase/DNA-(apurinic or apyrimidinic site) lyase [Ilumatobacter sp.]|nr:bifunctional DNA-formamidopyrimidine glycosylase/DNA-(apurinic or apyrimidinic site) lyase [Ilumatobacter sp.]
MPELPEVETVRRGLERFIVGRHVSKVEVGRERTVRRTSAREVIDGLTGTRITAANRRGKYLLLPLDSGDELMIHLRMSGQVLVADVGTERPPHTHVVLHLDPPDSDAAGSSGLGPKELWFVDPRTFGEVVVFDPTKVAVEVPELAKMGIDPITDGLSLKQLRSLLRSRHRLLKPLLLDLHSIAGIGNIYADEILHAARLRPNRLSDELSPASERRLHESILGVLTAAIDAGGSTLGDAQYVDLFGAGGSYQDAHRVYSRTGERCITCGVGWIRHTVSAQRSTHFCPRCQR